MLAVCLACFLLNIQKTRLEDKQLGKKQTTNLFNVEHSYIQGGPNINFDFFLLASVKVSYSFLA